MKSSGGFYRGYQAVFFGFFEGKGRNALGLWNRDMQEKILIKSCSTEDDEEYRL